jgi:UDP-N-acetylglucosamine diphosphorylase / glucose-1-phosphate thymidylyltransferase / UDP-N-acetylgalactosamine diphosphorylase / glucosamine-1-phosphate N-acetyltransferase / galactosamine-1-phosphate N-acetyltransferase
VTAVFYLYDDIRARAFEPFSLSRPVGELRAGAELIRRRWEIALGARCAGFLGAPHLADFDEDQASSAATGSELPSGSIVVNARCAPVLAPAVQADLWRCGQQIAAVRLLAARPAAAFADGRLDLSALPMPTARLGALHGWWLENIWDLIRHLVPMLSDDITRIAPSVTREPGATATILGDHAVVIEAGSRVEPMVVLDATAGPILIRRGASVASFTRLAGPSVIGFDSQLLGGKVSTVSIGEHCRVHGEMSTTVMIGHANKGHDGFVGHSVLGRWSNLGASTVTSNLKNTYGTVQLWTPSGLQDTGLQFLGTMFGDHAKTGIGTRLTTGSVIGTGANVVTTGVAPKVVPPFAWGESDATYDIDRFVQVAERVMARREVALSQRARRLLASAYAARWRTGA